MTTTANKTVYKNNKYQKFKDKSFVNTIIIINVIVFISTVRTEYYSNFLLSRSTITEQPLSFILYGFQHANFIHLFINMSALYMIIHKDEEILNRSKIVFTYFVSLVASALFVLWLSNPEMKTVGASGAIMGIVGLMTTYNKFANRRREMWLNIVFMILISFVPFVSWQGHLGGFLAGAIIGYIYNIIEYKKETKYLKNYYHYSALHKDVKKLFDNAIKLSKKEYLYINKKSHYTDKLSRAYLYTIMAFTIFVNTTHDSGQMSDSKKQEVNDFMKDVSMSMNYVMAYLDKYLSINFWKATKTEKEEYAFIKKFHNDYMGLAENFTVDNYLKNKTMIVLKEKSNE